MSKSDRTMPWKLRQDDPTVPGYVYHNHLEIVHRRCGDRYVRSVVIHACDYDPRGNTANFRSRSTLVRCIRLAEIFSCEKMGKTDRRLVRHSERALLRQRLQACKRGDWEAVDSLNRRSRNYL